LRESTRESRGFLLAFIWKYGKTETEKQSELCRSDPPIEHVVFRSLFCTSRYGKVGFHIWLLGNLREA
jgi:hypothetical protein